VAAQAIRVRRARGGARPDDALHTTFDMAARESSA